MLMEINLDHKSCLKMYDLGNLGQSRTRSLGWLTTRAAGREKGLNKRKEGAYGRLFIGPTGSIGRRRLEFSICPQ